MNKNTMNKNSMKEFNESVFISLFTSQYSPINNPYSNPGQTIQVTETWMMNLSYYYSISGIKFLKLTMKVYREYLPDNRIS